jgi:hypothetical protein
MNFIKSKKMYRAIIIILLALIIIPQFVFACKKTNSDDWNFWSDEFDLNSKNWKLIWSDEFDADNIDTTNWTVQNSYWKKTTDACISLNRYL